MWLIIIHYNDLSGIWLYNEIKKRYPGETEVVTAEALPYALHWNHHVGNIGDSVSFTLPNGKMVESGKIKGVVNRVYSLNNQLWRKMGPTDQMYVNQELSGLYSSWLSSLTCKVYNKPTPSGLSGAFRQEAEWQVMAAKAGLPTAKYEKDSATNEITNNIPAASGKMALVFNDQVFGLADEPHIANGCLQMARLSGLPMLGIYFNRPANNGLVFSAATPIPELFGGGEKLVEGILYGN